MRRRDFLERAGKAVAGVILTDFPQSREQRVLNPTEIVRTLVDDVEKRQIVRKISYLKRYLKNYDPDGLFAWVEYDLGFLKQCGNKINRGVKLTEKDDLDLRLLYAERWDDSEIQGHEVALVNPTISGFEKIERWSNQRVMDLLNEVAPKGWPNLRRLTIEYNPSAEELRDTLKQRKGLSFSHDLDHLAKPGAPRRILIGELQPNMSGVNSDRQALLDVLLHELAHQNDWLNSPRIGMASRVEFLYDVAQLLKSKGTLPLYVTEIRETAERRGEKLQSGEIEYREVSEFWATLAEDLSVPEIVRKGSDPNTFPIVQKWVKATGSVKQVKP